VLHMGNMMGMVAARNSPRGPPSPRPSGSIMILHLFIVRCLGNFLLVIIRVCVCLIESLF
jgi:hypothetical protein